MATAVKSARKANVIAASAGAPGEASGFGFAGVDELLFGKFGEWAAAQLRPDSSRQALRAGSRSDQQEASTLRSLNYENEVEPSQFGTEQSEGRAAPRMPQIPSVLGALSRTFFTML